MTTATTAADGPCRCKRAHVQLQNEARFLHSTYVLAVQTNLGPFRAAEREILDMLTFGIILLPFCVFWSLGSPELWQWQLLLRMLVFPWYGVKEFWLAPWNFKFASLFLYSMLGGACRRHWFPRSLRIRLFATALARRRVQEIPQFRLWRSNHPLEAFMPVPCRSCGRQNRWVRSQCAGEFYEWLRAQSQHMPDAERMLQTFDSTE
jgi:hypothetical protein